jgi:hypothetical protein
MWRHIGDASQCSSQLFVSRSREGRCGGGAASSGGKASKGREGTPRRCSRWEVTFIVDAETV